MSRRRKSHPFEVTQERPIPPSPGPLPSLEDRVYVMSMKIEDGHMQFYFKDRPASPDPTGDGPLELRVPKNCTIVLKLDEALQWEFRHYNAIMTGPMNYTDHPRYFNLTPTIVDGVCKEVRFNALYLDESVTNFDTYSIYVNCLQLMQDGGEATSLLIRIDPDIQNPGDHIRPS